MNNRLNIYACSGIGSADNSYGYWTDGTQSVSNSQAVNNLLAKINLEYAKVVNLDLTDEQILRCLDNIDMYCVCMYYAREYGNNEAELHHVGEVIGEMVAAGAFESNLLEDEERGTNLDELFDRVDKAMELPVHPSEAWMGWWRENVEELNRVGLSQEQQATVTRSLMGDMVGAADYGNADLNKYLNDAGEYFLYTYFTDAQLSKLPKVFARKAKVQKNLYQYCKALYVEQNGTESSMKEIIRGGIISTLKAEPEAICTDIYNKFKKDGSVGEAATVAMIGALTIAEFITVLTTVLTFVGGIIAAICTAVANVKVAEAQAVDSAAIGMSAPNEDDYPDSWKETLGGSSNYLLIGAAVLAAVLLFRK